MNGDTAGEEYDPENVEARIRPVFRRLIWRAVTHEAGERRLVASRR